MIIEDEYRQQASHRYLKSLNEKHNRPAGLRVVEKD